jgi:hypothetical protein
MTKVLAPQLCFPLAHAQNRHLHRQGSGRLKGDAPVNKDSGKEIEHQRDRLTWFATESGNEAKLTLDSSSP